MFGMYKAASGSIRALSLLLVFVAVAASSTEGLALVVCLCRDGALVLEARCEPTECCDEEGAWVPSELVPSRMVLLGVSDDDCVDLPIGATADAVSETSYPVTPGAKFLPPARECCQAVPSPHAHADAFGFGPPLLARATPPTDVLRR